MLGETELETLQNRDTDLKFVIFHNCKMTSIFFKFAQNNKSGNNTLVHFLFIYSTFIHLCV